MQHEKDTKNCWGQFVKPFVDFKKPLELSQNNTIRQKYIS
jgi:hypothetical protein